MYVAAVLALAVASLGAPAPAPSLQSGPWEPWYGCWRPTDAPGQSVCILPAGDGVRLLTVEKGELRGDARIYADGVARQRQQDGCTMDEWARWSADRERVFLTSELTCDGQVTRRSQGVLAFTSPDEWVSVQTINSEDGTALRTVRFAPALGVSLPASVGAAPPVRALRSSRIASLDESDVIEATDVLDPETVQEWLHVAGAPFQVTDSYEGSVTSSALDDLAGVARPVEYRTVNVVNVVRILEPSWCIFGSCSWLRTYWWWDPWGYDRWGWRSIYPVVYWGRPALIHVGINIGWGRPIRIARYDGWGRGRDWWRYDYPDRWRAGRGIAWASGGRGTVGPGGYRPPYSGTRDDRPGIGRASAGGDRPGSAGPRGSAIGRSTAGSNGGATGRVAPAGERAGSGTGEARGTAIVRRTSTGGSTSGTRGSVTVRRSDGSSVTVTPGSRDGSGSGTSTGVGSRGYSSGSGTARGSAVSRGGQGSGSDLPQRVPIRRSEAPPSGSPTSRSAASSNDGWRGTAIPRSSSSGSGSYRSPSASRGSWSAPSSSRAPSVSRGSSSGSGSSRAPSVSRGSSSGSGSSRAPSVSRGSSSGGGSGRASAGSRGYSSGGGSARGSARSRQ